MTDKPTSPFISDWTPEERERYQFRAREYYKLFNEMRLEAQRNHVEYGKWLIATMVAIHGGAIYAINAVNNARPQLEETAQSLLLHAAGWHVVGIVCIMFAGFMAWLNFQCAEALYDDWANPEMTYRSDRWPKAPKRDPITATLFLAAAFGMLSAWAFIAGAVNAFRAL